MGSLNVHVTYSSGKGKKGVKVTGEVSGFFGGMTKSTRTNSDGHAMLEWSSSKSLGAIFIDGKKHSGKYTSGSSYSFQG